jgi:hypothetical protein
MELLNKKKQTDRPILVFLLPHGVIHAKKVKKRPRSIIFLISKAAWPRKNLEKSI